MMDDGIVFRPQSNNSGHDIGPDEDRPGYFTVEAILGPQNYEHGPNYTLVQTHRPREPIDQSRPGETSPGKTSDGIKYFSESQRLKTFNKWKHSYHVKPTDLARNGFIHAGPGDLVLCVFCLKTIVDWEAGDVVENEHKRIYPDCPFVKGKCSDVNIPISGLGNLRRDYRVVQKGCDAMYPTYVSKDDREATFVNWPEALRHKDPSPKALAEAGFFYFYKVGKEDRVKCFMCGKMVYKWEVNDDPWVEHAKLSPKCKFVLQERGFDFVERACGRAPSFSMPPQNEAHEPIQGASAFAAVSHNSEEDLMESTAVRAILDNYKDEYTVEEVCKAMEELKFLNDPSQPVTAEQLLAKIEGRNVDSGEWQFEYVQGNSEELNMDEDIELEF